VRCHIILWSTLLALLTLAPSPVAAWGRDGHALIAELAERRLSAEALADVRQLLIDEPDAGLAAVASWADAVREQDGWRWTAPLHYVNHADASCARAAPRGCERGLCLPQAIERYRDQLADASLSRRQRAEALKFVVHFVGDVHQPLHTGYRPDRGGNLFQINIDGEGSNLHSVWDGRVLQLRRGGFRADADRLQSDLPDTDTGGTPWQWASASCRMIDAHALYPARPGRLPQGYLENMKPLAEAQVQLAAARLAAMLEDALTAARTSHSSH
jgi:hypothetical protein